MNHIEQEDNNSRLSERIESHRKTRGSNEGVSDRMSKMVGDLTAETMPVSGVIADRLIFTEPLMFPRKVWGGPRGLPSPRRMKRLFDLLGIPEGTLPPSEAFLLRFQVNGADWVPHPENAPFWALASPEAFASLGDGREFTLCKQWESGNNENANRLVKAKLAGLDVRSKGAFLFGGGTEYIEVAFWLDSPDPQLFDVGSVWRREAELASLVKKLFPDAIREYSPPWLGWQRLDIFVPSRALAFEYQGEQHYRPIEFFGGMAGYAGIVERDRRKKLLCEANSVTLIEWEYTTPISEQHLLRHLALVGIRDIQRPAGQGGQA